MESTIFRFLSPEDESASIVGFPSALATVVFPGQRLRLKWDPRADRRCVVCGKFATSWGKQWANLDGLRLRDRYGQQAIIREAYCTGHMSSVNPCVFHTQAKFAPGCDTSAPRCHRMHSECILAVLYLASSDSRLKTPIKVGQCQVSAISFRGDEWEIDTLRRRVKSGGYARAMVIAPDDGDLWLGSAQFLEEQTTRYANIPQQLFRGGPSKSEVVPFFIGRDDPDSLRRTAVKVVQALKGQSMSFPDQVRDVALSLSLGSETTNPCEALVDKPAVQALAPEEIRVASKRRTPQDLMFEVLGVRGKYILGRDPRTTEGYLINTQSLAGLEVGVEEA